MEFFIYKNQEQKPQQNFDSGSNQKWVGFSRETEVWQKRSWFQPGSNSSTPTPAKKKLGFGRAMKDQLQLEQKKNWLRSAPHLCCRPTLLYMWIIGFLSPTMSPVSSYSQKFDTIVMFLCSNLRKQKYKLESTISQFQQQFQVFNVLNYTKQAIQ